MKELTLQPSEGACPIGGAVCSHMGVPQELHLGRTGGTGVSAATGVLAASRAQRGERSCPQRHSGMSVRSVQEGTDRPGLSLRSEVRGVKGVVNNA